MIFHDYTLQGDGNIRSHRVTDSTKLEPAAVDIFRPLVRQSNYEGLIHPKMPEISLKWTSEGNQALAAFLIWGEMATTSALADSAAAQVFLTLTKILTQPSINLYPEVPAIISIPWPVIDVDSLMMISDMETCMAAAWVEMVSVPEPL